MFGMWRCAVWPVWMSEGKESPPSARPTLIHTITHQQTVTHAISTILLVLYSYYGTFMSACKVITLLHGFTWFCTKCWDTFIINTCSCIFSFLLFKLCFFIANCIHCQCIIYISIYFQVAYLQKPHETFKKLKNAQNSFWEADCI